MVRDSKTGRYELGRHLQSQGAACHCHSIHYISPHPVPCFGLTRWCKYLVLSFMSQFSAGTKTPPPSTSPPSDSPHRPGHRKTNSGTEPFPDHRVSADISRPNTPPSRPDYGTPLNGGSPIEPSARRRRSSSAASSRPPSMVLGHQPAIMDITEDTIPELQPIFSFLNSHSNKLYQEVISSNSMTRIHVCIS